MKLITHGCRGSIPNPSKEMLKYGGNTTCFELSMDDFQVFFDTGSGFQNAVLDSNKQIIIVDDGSVDGTSEFLKKLKSHNITTIFHKNNLQ